MPSPPHRILLLIDLTPLLTPPTATSPTTYTTQILNTTKALLSHPPLLHSLSSFKLFYSSLSPLLSSSCLPSFSNFSFNLPNQTLISLSQTLASILSNSPNCPLPISIPPFPSSTHLSESLTQVIHDYPFEDFDCFDEKDCSFDLIGGFRSNLVVLFSPVCRSLDSLAHFISFDDENVDLNVDDDFVGRFRDVFGCVRDAYVARDIHFCWVNVSIDVENDDPDGGFGDGERVMRLFKSGVKGLGWGFCSSDSIVLGSALVPFGLIYPMIGGGGVGLGCEGLGGGESKRVLGNLSLEILDVNGKPLECKCCDLELVHIKALCGGRIDVVQQVLENEKAGVEMCDRFGGVLDCFRGGVVKVDVKRVFRHSEVKGIEGHVSDLVLVRELSVDLKKRKVESGEGFFADRVIGLLARETGMSVKNKSPPFWQIFLSFVYRKGYWALVSLLKGDGSVIMGILKPYTVHSAFLCVLKGITESQFGSLLEQNLRQINFESGENIGQCDAGAASLTRISGSEKRRKHKKPALKYKDLSWSSFCKAAYEHCEMELEEACLSLGCETSKKLKFFKCWMKQVEKNCSSLPCKEKTEGSLSQLHQENDQPLPSSARQKDIMEPRAGETTPSYVKTAETFFNTLSERIQRAIDTGVDLEAFSKRIVFPSTVALNVKLGVPEDEESQGSAERLDGSSHQALIIRELMKLLLKDPKKLAGKKVNADLSANADVAIPSATPATDKVREYELQILFRMEILALEISAGIKEPLKNKFVKQICCFLELIQCNMEDGFFGDFDLNDYVGRTIRSRYSKDFEDVVHRIYDEMDLLLFDDEDESPNLLLNSEDSNKSRRVGDNERSEPNSADDSLSGSLRDNERSREEKERMDDDRRLAEAQERRQRALRFSSNTRRAIPDLQRVWAPKPSKLSRSYSDTSQRSKKKHRRRESYDMVCETPMSGTKKCLFPPESSIWGDCSSSVNKSLFQDDLMHHDWEP